MGGGVAQPDGRGVFAEVNVQATMESVFDAPMQTSTYTDAPALDPTKWKKQHLRIELFFGTSGKAVKTQIWIAVSV